MKKCSIIMGGKVLTVEEKTTDFLWVGYIRVV